MCDVLGKTTKWFANMVALGAEKDWLITHDENYGWEISVGGLSNAVITLYLANITW
jgi:hypothetical protein